MRDVAWLLNARARSNLLHRPVREAGVGAVTDVVRRVAGLQAQLPSGAALAVRSRSTSTVWSDVDDARVRDRSVVRGWFMRGTLQLVATEDYRWLLDMFAPVVVAGTERRYRELGLSASIRERSVAVLSRELLRHGPLDRSEIAEILLSAGLITSSRGQAVYALIRHAGLQGVLCYGPDRDGAETWVAVRDWLDPAATSAPPRGRTSSRQPDRPPEPLTDLARRYLTAYGPASPLDFATWSGLPVSLCRKAFGDVSGLVEFRVGEDVVAALDPDSAASPIRIRLLGPFDPYLLGYRNREAVVDAAYGKRVNAGGGMIAPVVLSDGRAIGTWKPDRRRGPTSVDLFRPDPTLDLTPELIDITRFSKPD